MGLGKLCAKLTEGETQKSWTGPGAGRRGWPGSAILLMCILSFLKHMKFKEIKAENDPSIQRSAENSKSGWCWSLKWGGQAAPRQWLEKAQAHPLLLSSLCYQLSLWPRQWANTGVASSISGFGESEVHPGSICRVWASHLWVTVQAVFPHSHKHVHHDCNCSVFIPIVNPLPWLLFQTLKSTTIG